jgi:P4 family phage/plasmid primase-like protien
MGGCYMSYKLRDPEYVKAIKDKIAKVDLSTTRRYEDLAMQYVERGYSVTPVIFKRPYINQWQTFKEEEVFSQKWYRGANGIGILTGAINGLICLDIDMEDESNPIRQELEKMLPPIYAGKIGNPKRPPARFFRYNYEDSAKFHNIGVEILSDGNQSVLYESQHDIYDKEYEVVGASLLEIDVDDLPDIPTDIIPWLHKKEDEARERNKKNSIKTVNGQLSSKSMSEFELVRVPGRCCHNSYNVLSHFAVYLCKEGHGFEFVVSETIKKDEEINKDSDFFFFNCPERPEFKRKGIIEAAEYFVGQVFNKHATTQINIRDIFNDKQYRFFRPKIETGFTKNWYDEKGRFKYQRKFLDLFKYLKALHVAEYIPENRSFAIWNGKHYQLKGEDFIKMFAQDNFKKPEVSLIGDRSTFLELVKNKQQVSIDKYTLKDTGYINLANGVYCLKTKTLLDHDKSYNFTHIINTPYSETDECPTWDELLKNITLDRPHMAKVIEEFIGYIVSACDYNKFNKILILDGAGSNGKSTLIRIIKDLVGILNCSAVDLETIGRDRFSAYPMFNRLVNFSSEVPNEAFSNTGALKKITGGDPIMVEEKHKGAFLADIKAKFIISYNKMPFFPDTSAGMRRRIILVRCDQDYDKYPERRIDDVEYKVGMERPAVLRRCIKAYEAVVERGAFTEVPEGMERYDEMVKKSNPVHSFFDEYLTLTKDANAVLKNTDLYDQFLDFQGGHTKMKKKTFCDSLIELANQIGSKQNDDFVIVERYRAANFRGIKGLQWKPFSKMPDL